MSTGSYQFFVTFVASDDDVLDSLVLAKSIRDTFTHRKVIALHGPQLSSKAKKQITPWFDAIFQIGLDFGWKHEDWETCAKVHCWSLPLSDKCVFLSSNFMILKNCDDIFALPEVTVLKKGENGLDTSLMVVSPCATNYYKILEAFQQKFALDKSETMSMSQFFDEQLLKLFPVYEMDNELTANIGYKNTGLHDNSSSHGTHRIVRIGKETKLNLTDKEKAILKHKEELAHSILNTTVPSRNVEYPSKAEPIAIVGMSCRFPGANSLDEFWDLMISHGDAITTAPADRWSSVLETNLSEDQKHVQAGWLKCPINQFDEKFFGMSPLEVSNTDPQQRFLLELSWEALEDSATDVNSLQGSRFGIFTGIWTHMYQDVLLDNGYKQRDFFRTYLGNAFGTAAGRIAHFLNADGPNICTESGCSSSMVAVGLACESLRKGTSDIALATGVNLFTRAFGTDDLQSLCAPDGHCKTFDSSANGFGRAEGCAALVLKRVSDAVRDGDRIHALIRGYGASQEGSSSSMGTPTVDGEALAMQQALKDANVDPDDVSFVEAHGTGTAVGDPLEIKAISTVYGGASRSTPLVIGSVKTNIGHTESCSGMAGILKTVLALKKETIPPHRSLEKLNPLINLEAIPAIIPLEPKEWKSDEKKPRRAGVSSFGITGTDAHVIIEEAPKQLKTMSLELPEHNIETSNIFTLSTKSEDALPKQLKAYQKFLENTTHSFNDVAYTANHGRTHFSNRIAVVANSCKELSQKIQKSNFHQGSNSVSAGKPKVCFLFTGQGSQYHEMGRSLYKNSPVFKSSFDECDNILQKKFKISIKDAIWGDTNTLHDSLYSQTSIFVIEYCVTNLLEKWGIKPEYVLGHSLGEFAAAVCAKLISLEDALTLVGVRSTLINGLPTGKMIVAKADEHAIRHFLKLFNGLHPTLWLDFAAINSSDQTTLSGTEKAVTEFANFCKNQEIKTHILNATHAFHSRDMEPILEDYKRIAKSVKQLAPQCTFVSSLDGQEKTNLDENYWVSHTREAVQFIKACKSVFNSGVRTFLEVGPNPTLSALMKTNVAALENVEPINCGFVMKNKSEEWPCLLDAVANLYVNGVNVNWKEFHKHQIKQKIELPLYPFQRKPHWIDFEAKLPIKLTSLSATKVHPLIGWQITSPCQQVLFQNFINQKTISYILDHKVGSHVIYPASGYLEMSLAAGYAALFTQKDNQIHPDTLIALQNLNIKTPFELLENETYELQTIVQPSMGEENSSWTQTVTYSRRKEVLNSETHKWTCHSEAKFSCSQSEIKHPNFLLLSNARDNITQKVGQEIYPKLSKLGYKFGPKFQSLKNIWKRDSEVLAEVAVPIDDILSYICHPVVVDAMIQSCVIAKMVTTESLQLPVSVQSFVWLQKPMSPTNFIHVSLNKALNLVAVLYDESGEVLAYMSGVELLKTTISGFEKQLKSKKNQLVPLFEEQWRPQPSKSTTYQLNEPFLLANLTDCRKSMQIKTESKAEDDERQNLDNIIAHGILKALMDLGWNTAQVGDKIEIHSLMKKLGIMDNLFRMMQHIFRILVQDGWVKASSRNPNAFQVKKEFPKTDEFTIFKNGLRTFKFLNVEWECSKLFLENMSDLLTGKMSALSLLFPEHTATVDANSFYCDTVAAKKSLQLIGGLFEYLMSATTTERQHLRILEVGGGVGSTTQIILPVLKRKGIKFIYHFTDISPTFFPKAKSNFVDYAKSMEYSALNIEEDPKLQGFVPYDYDIVIASNVLHATKNLTNACRNVRNLTKPAGLLLIVETFHPIRYLDIAFGHLDGYWRFTDYETRPFHCTLHNKDWIKLLNNCGYPTAFDVTMYGDGYGAIVAESTLTPPNFIAPSTQKRKSWVVFANRDEFSADLISKIENEGRFVYVVNKNDVFKKIDPTRYDIDPKSKSDVQSIFDDVASSIPDTDLEGIVYLWSLDILATPIQLTESYLNLTQVLIATKFSTQPRTYLVTEGQMYVGDQEPRIPNAGTLLGLSRVFRSETPALFCKTIDIDPSLEMNSSAVETTFTELWRNSDKETLVTYRQGVRNVARLKPIKQCLSFGPLEIPNGENYALVLPKTKSISDLKFVTKARRELKDLEVEVRIKAAGLNFRDVFSVLKPSTAFEKMNSVGTDFSGVITKIGVAVKNRKVGESVLGCRLEDVALPSHVILPENQLVLLPQNWTYADGATLPCVFATAYESLCITGKLRKGDTILIHTASGGVGLCAIQLANSIGATVIATAGSRRKRAYLKNMGVPFVLNSRTLEFGKEIMKITNNKGVDFVLNSLTGPGFKETTLNACKTNATFIEMSKINVWSSNDVKCLRPDVKYTIVDLSVPDEVMWENLMTHLSAALKQDTMKPLPSTTFGALNIRDALKYLERAKHIGKVICLMPEVNVINGLVEVKTKLFNEFSSYLVTGGLKGIGLEVAKWMASSGAKHLILCGRSQPDEYTLKVINELRVQNVNVVVMHADIGNFEHCKRVFKAIENPASNLPPIRGVMHSAGCLSDATIPNQTIEKFEITMNPKVKGGWNLHLLTKDLNLEHFVVFSSVCSILGHSGQSNHGASNSYLDALAQYRNSLGLAATSINWGQWGETGVAAEKKVAAFNPFSTAHGINSLEHILSSNITQVIAADGDISVWKAGFQWGKTYMEEIKLENAERVDKILTITSEEFWAEINATNDFSKHYEIICGYLSKILTVALKSEGNEKIEKHQEFQEFGMDSLMMIEFRNHIQLLLGSAVTLSATDMADCNTLDQLTNKILSTISAVTKKAKKTDDVDHALLKLIKEDSVLWDHIRGDGKTVKPSEVKTVLLTGATGFLGPYMLRDLTLYPQIQKIYCLVRESKGKSTMDKLKARLVEIGLADEVNMSKVETVSGDVGQVALGMSEEAYEKLAAECEGVVHCAVYANHLESYRKIDTKHANLRAVNVIGTQRMLEFAVSKRTKLVYHASTAFAMGTGVVTRFGDCMPEEWPEEEHHDTKTSFGYMISKYIAERLVGQAVKERNIPCKAYRFAKVGGDSRDGRQAVKTNHFFMKFLCYLKSETMPVLDFPLQLVAVDHCSKLTLDIFLRDDCPSEVYNVFNPFNHNEKEIAQLGKEFGFNVKYVSFDDFSKRVEADGEKSLLYHWSAFYSDPNSVFRLYESAELETPIIKAWKNDPDFFNKGNLTKHIPNIKQIVGNPIDLLRKEIKYAIKTYDVFNK